uniref:Uncharacterized protein n=1 Tax=Branchiostoma floridae TaxID=7739 RepID=C3ZD44_BRAFL|eukprot:XP_002593544.1 hypothetical protein BRAFLDRAFT_88521 [Branchiostoma floridae]
MEKIYKRSTVGSRKAKRQACGGPMEKIYKRSLGVFFLEFVDHFDTTYGKTSWITSITLASMYGGVIRYSLGHNFPPRPPRESGEQSRGASIRKVVMRQKQFVQLALKPFERLIVKEPEVS